MKKILLVIASIMIAIVTNAASVTWQILNVQSSPKTAVSSGWLVQIYSSSVTYDYAKALAGEISSKFTGATKANGSTFKVSQVEANAAEASEAVSIYAVIYDASTVADAKYYIVSDIASKTVSEGGGDISISFGNMAGGTSANKFLSSQWTAVVPEPTSGLLMLLGMAGLALKRKHV